MRGVGDNNLVPRLDLGGKKNADTERDDGGQRVPVNTAAAAVVHTTQSSIASPRMTAEMIIPHRRCKKLWERLRESRRRGTRGEL